MSERWLGKRVKSTIGDHEGVVVAVRGRTILPSGLAHSPTPELPPYVKLDNNGIEINPKMVKEVVE